MLAWTSAHDAILLSGLHLADSDPGNWRVTALSEQWEGMPVSVSREGVCALGTHWTVRGLVWVHPKA